MSDLNTLFDNLSDPDYMLADDEILFEIDNNLRVTDVRQEGSVIGVVGDMNVNNVNFKMPKWYNGFDLSTFEIYVVYVNANNVGGYYKVSSQEKIITDDGYIAFAWLVGSKVCESAGTVTFGVKMRKLAGAKIAQEFNTKPATATVEIGTPVPSGMTLQSDQGTGGYDALEVYLQYISDYISDELDELSDLPDNVATLQTKVTNLETWKTDTATTKLASHQALIESNLSDIIELQDTVNGLQNTIEGTLSDSDILGLMEGD